METCEKEIEKCLFVPKKSLQRALNFIENKLETPNPYCKRNLLQLQISKGNQESSKHTLRSRWRTTYQILIARAIYSHDWNKLLHFLTKSPPWDHQITYQLRYYIRALTILLLYHPEARSRGLYNEYLHLALSCRSVEDKKAVLKIILSLTERIRRKGNLANLCP